MKGLFITSLIILLMVNNVLGAQPISKENVNEIEQAGTFMWIETKDHKNFLISTNGRFLIENPLILDMKTKKKIASVKDLRASMKPDIANLAVFYLAKQGNPTALLVVDEYCPYCERFVKDILTLIKQGKKPKYDLAVTFYPVHRESIDATCKLMTNKSKAKEIYLQWVNTEDSSVWNSLKCDPSVRDQYFVSVADLRLTSGITSTPTVIMPDGQKMVGYRNPEEFLF